MVLLTGSSTFGSLAQLKCPNGQVASEGNTIIECLENGTWSLLLANCQFEVNPERMQRRISGSHGRNIDSRIGTILCSVIFGILFCILVLVAFLFKKKILLIKFESDKRRKQSPRVSGSTLKRTNEYKGSKVVLSEFRCSLPMATSSMGPVRRLTSGHNEEKIYQEINDKGVQSSSSSKRPYSPKTLAFDRECLAAVEQNVPHSLLEEKIEKVESPSITLRPDCDLLDDEHSESSEDGSDPSSVLYAEIDIQKRTKPLPELPIEDEPATGSTSIPLEPYVVIDNAIYSGHPMVRRPSARF
ncbi:hypothetical protein HDE_10131 [Halotydeus destructor]|nr:hypothetical protein HDE_10131 [Halotydeus destructor]